MPKAFPTLENPETCVSTSLDYTYKVPVESAIRSHVHETLRPSQTFPIPMTSGDLKLRFPFQPGKAYLDAVQLQLALTFQLLLEDGEVPQVSAPLPNNKMPL